ncbi:tetratricopeptide repeat protein [Mesorhizobium xinjiangense]|uniref:tetratricopeptide repeat protein n=1 Tax=Mesorhizobium xinjiangense TaxID=2678685 RepID=UPI0038B36BC3
MRSFLRYIAIFALLCGPALAQGPDLPNPPGLPEDPELPAPAPDMPVPEGERSQSRLDELFGELKRERNEKAAERIANRIWGEWLKSGSATIDLLMQWSNEATREKKFNVALDFLDQVLVLQPDYAEAWNRRATVHFMMNNYAKSMADISRTLQLEPRHFGALSGMGAIMRATGNDKLALEAFERALGVYPMMRNAQEEVERLADELAGEGI